MFMIFEDWHALTHTQKTLEKVEKAYDLLNKFQDLDIDHDREEFISNYMIEEYNFEMESHIE